MAQRRPTTVPRSPWEDVTVPLICTGLAALLHVSYCGVTFPAATLAEVVSSAVTGWKRGVSCMQQPLSSLADVIDHIRSLYHLIMYLVTRRTHVF